MELIIRILLFLMYLFGLLVLGISSDVTVPEMTPTPATASHQPIIIEQVEVIAQMSLPARAAVHVEGFLPDGCPYEVGVEQSRSGNTVNVQIYRLVPAQSDVICTQALVPYENTIQIDGTFEPGTYTFNINDQSITAEF